MNTVTELHDRARPTGEPGSVDPAPVREHLAALVAAGLTRETIAARAGVGRRSLSRLTAGRTTRLCRGTAAAILAVPVPESPDYIDPRPAREHLAALRDAGLGVRRAALLAGLPTTTLRRIAAGERARIHAATAAAILAVPLPDVEQLAAVVSVDGTGTRRRIQALMRNGWPVPQIASRAGLARQTLYNALDGGRVAASTAATMALAYDELWDAAPDDSTPELAAFVARARAQAEAAGWPPPMAWDDDAIDDPAMPRPVDAVGASGRLRLDLDEWAFLVRGGEEAERAAARFGVTLGAVEQAAGPSRHARPDVLALMRAARAARVDAAEGVTAWTA